jgi:hypothetical protein
MSDDPPENEAALSPQLEAMHRAMRQAEEAAERRRQAKLQAREDQEADPEIAMLAELALVNEPVDRNQKPTFVSYALGDENDLDSLIAEAAAQTPDAPGEERDGDLVIMRHENQAAPWYQEAAEAALPAALRELAGPVDVKTLLQALIVEIGDVKRTNALLLEHLTRVEEKVDRTNRQLKDRRSFHG